ncbi:MAG: 2-dehydropantoate 2-reductase, partial [Clostridia bacterium]|nr:2-dehydropantoate 2-reductase [Clostridia bacterium]
MEFKRIGILGAGAVGAYVIWGLSQKPGTELFLIAEGARKERLEKNGLTINGKSYLLPVKMPGEACAPDLLV